MTAFGRKGSRPAFEIAVASLREAILAFGEDTRFGAPTPKRAQRFQLRSAHLRRAAPYGCLRCDHSIHASHFEEAASRLPRWLAQEAASRPLARPSGSCKGIAPPSPLNPAQSRKIQVSVPLADLEPKTAKGTEAFNVCRNACGSLRRVLFYTGRVLQIYA